METRFIPINNAIKIKDLIDKCPEAQIDNIISEDSDPDTILYNGNTIHFDLTPEIEKSRNQCELIDYFYVRGSNDFTPFQKLVDERIGTIAYNKEYIEEPVDDTLAF